MGNILDITGALTVGAWIKSDTSSGYQGIVNKSDNTTGVSNYHLRMDTTTGYGVFRVYGASTVTVTGDIALGDDVWHHVVGVYSPSNYVRIYIDGVLNNENVTSIPASLNSSSKDVLIGAWLENDVPITFFDGTIDDARIYNYALTASQIRNVYNEGSSVRFGPSSGLP